MSVNPVEFLSLNTDLMVGMDAVKNTDTNFTAWLDKQISEVNDQIINADNQLRSLAVGDAENLHQVMMAMEKAKLNFSMVLQVRNKVLEAYQEMMRMQL